MLACFPSIMHKVLFQPPSTSFEPAFWEELYNLKLNVQKLNSTEKSIRAIIKCSDGRFNQAMAFSAQSYDAVGATPIVGYTGAVSNLNTLEVRTINMLML